MAVPFNHDLNRKTAWSYRYFGWCIWTSLEQSRCARLKRDLRMLIITDLNFDGSMELFLERAERPAGNLWIADFNDLLNDDLSEATSLLTTLFMV